MTDHLAEARAAIHADHGWSMAAPASSLADMAYAIARILDHLEAQRIDPQQLAASIRRGLDDVAAGRTEYLGRFTDDEPEPEPDYGPRPAGCCGTCPPILGGGYDCTCVDNPRCDANKADRIDCDGDRWKWCDTCGGFHSCLPGLGVTAVWIDERYGPVTFAPRPADTPTTAPQPDEAHGDTPNPARPAERHTAPETYDVRLAWLGDEAIGSDADRDFGRWLDGICHEAWGEGYRAGRTDEQDACHCKAWSDDECGCGRYGATATPNPYRKDQA